MSQLITILNGPNLNMLGKRQPEIYGSDTLDDIAARCAVLGKTLGVETELKQTNHEGELVDMIHSCRDTSAGIIINPAAYSHTSIAILDALNVYDGKVIEVHISNIHQREEFRHHSFVSARADGVIAGCGAQGYELALMRIAAII